MEPNLKGLKELVADPEVAERVDRLGLRFNRYGIDPLGLSREHLIYFFNFLRLFYRHYFRVQTRGAEHVPAYGRAMVVGNHSGGLPVDGGMVLASLFFDHEPPRLAHGMVEKFAFHLPFISTWFSRVGQFTGLPDHAVGLLEAERVLMVFPEGARGTGKLYSDRYQLVDFGTGFLRLALRTRTPIVPFAFVGGEEALPTLFHFQPLAKLFGTPYWPVPPYLVPIPRPVQCDLCYGAPLTFQGSGNEDDEWIAERVEEVKAAVTALIVDGREQRRIRLGRQATVTVAPPAAEGGDA